MSRIILSTFLFMTGLLGFSREFYISPTGSDSNPGTKIAPFASVEKARNVIREINISDINNDITVYLRGGIYQLKKTITFETYDSAKDGYQIIYQAYEGEVPVITGSQNVSGWKKFRKYPKNTPKAAKGNLWCLKLEEGADPKMLYYHGKALKRARSNGFMPLANEKGSDNKTLIVPEGVPIEKLSNAAGIEVLIRPTFAWSMNILPVENIDINNRIIRTSVGGTYQLNPQPQWSLEAHNITETCWLENDICLLDEPGEWIFDYESNKIILWPLSQKPTDITVPTCTELLLIKGDKREDAPTDIPVKGLTFKGITFANNDRYTWRDNEPAFQHDWSAVDQANAMLRLRGAEDCVIEGCRFIDGGTGGIRLDLHCQYNKIEGNHIQHVGEHGITLCGYGPGTKDVNKHNQIINNRIDHCGENYWYAFGIYIAQSGENIIANNLIHNVPFVGITLSGCRDFNYGSPRNGEGYRSVRWQDINEITRNRITEGYKEHRELTESFYPFLHARNNIVEKNEIFSAVEIMGDGNAIYLSGAGTGNIIRKNYIHHILTSGIQTALRPDDLQEQTLFSENIVYKCVYGAVEHKHNNSYINNIFANIYPTNPQGQPWTEWAYILFGRGPNTGTRVQNNIFYDNIGADFRFYNNRGNSPLTDAVIDNNLYYSVNYPAQAQQALSNMQSMGLDAHSIVGNPEFEDINNGNFLLKKNSPAYQIGFRAIDTKKIGLETPWSLRLIGDQMMNVKISPETYYINEGAKYTVTITCDTPEAVVRYTTDGTEPTGKSTIYQSCLEFDSPQFIRAKAFKEGAFDLYGAAEFYSY